MHTINELILGVGLFNTINLFLHAQQFSMKHLTNIRCIAIVKHTCTKDLFIHLHKIRLVSDSELWILAILFQEISLHGELYKQAFRTFAHLAPWQILCISTFTLDLILRCLLQLKKMLLPNS